MRVPAEVGLKSKTLKLLVLLMTTVSLNISFSNYFLFIYVNHLQRFFLFLSFFFVPNKNRLSLQLRSMCSLWGNMYFSWFSPSIIKINTIHKVQLMLWVVHWHTKMREWACDRQASQQTDRSSFRILCVHYPCHLSISTKGLIFHCSSQSSNWYWCKLLINCSSWLKPSGTLALSMV